MKTGLLDLSGVEIEEGQLIVTDSYNGGPGGPGFLTDNRFYRVVYDHGAFVGRLEFSTSEGSRYPNGYDMADEADYGIVVLRDLVGRREGPYVSNFGNQVKFVGNVARVYVVSERDIP